MDAVDLNELDTKISQKGQSLARLTLKRLTHVVRQEFPEARTVRLTHDTTTGAYAVTRVTGHHNRVIWQDKPADRLTIKMGEAASAQVEQDAALYARLAGARLHVVREYKNLEKPDYSIHLHPGVA